MIHVGFGVILLLLLLAYLAIASQDPTAAEEIARNVAEISQAAQGVMP